MRVLLLILLITSFLFAKDWNIVCKGQAKTKDVINFFDPGSLAEYENGESYYNTMDVSLQYMDANSAACGGTLNANIRMIGLCDWRESMCYEYGVGKKGISLVEYSTDEKVYYNNVTYVNSLPCLPTDVNLHNIPLIPATENDILPADPYAYSPVFESLREQNYALSDEEAETQRTICDNLDIPKDEDEIDYSAQLDSIIDNTSENKNLVAINQRDEKLDNDLTTYVEGLTPEIDDEVSITDFQSTYELTLDDSFEAYSDVFGFGEYGSAPAPITFDFLGKNYEVFNINIIESHVDMIRNTFAIFAYLWGIIIVFRGV